MCPLRGKNNNRVGGGRALPFPPQLPPFPLKGIIPFRIPALNSHYVHYSLYSRGLFDCILRVVGLQGSISVVSDSLIFKYPKDRASTAA